MALSLSTHTQPNPKQGHSLRENPPSQDLAPLRPFPMATDNNMSDRGNTSSPPSPKSLVRDLQRPRSRPVARPHTLRTTPSLNILHFVQQIVVPRTIKQPHCSLRALAALVSRDLPAYTAVQVEDFECNSRGLKDLVAVRFGFPSA